MYSFKEYLHSKNYSASTVRRYLYNIRPFREAQRCMDNGTYQDILNYMDELGKNKLSINSRMGKLVAVKKYYDFLIETGKRETHPCRNLYLKGLKKRGVIFSDLFTSAELETLMNREERFAYLKEKNQVIISLLIYQGLLPKEITELKVQHINLETGTIYIKGGRINTERKLEFHPKQYILFDRYLKENRKRLLKARRSTKKCDSFILNYYGHPVTVEDVQTLIESMKLMFPDRNLTAKSIRDSVIANMLNEKKFPLEQVQLFAGHRWTCSTLRYKKADMGEQRELINKFHPLG